MGLFVPHSRALKGETNLSSASRPTTTWGTTVTASGTPHALTGTPTQIIAATAREYDWIQITVHGTATAATVTDGLLNLYLGASGGTLWIDSLMVGWAGGPTAGLPPRSYLFPIRVPRGVRISAEYRALIASDQVFVILELGSFNGGQWVGSGVETLGENTAASRGTSIATGGTSEGAWTSIGTTGRRYRYVMPSIMSNNDTTIVAEWDRVDIGVGSALYQGLENFILVNNATTESNWESETTHPRECDIPSGTALQMRARSHTTPSGVQYACIYGVY